jgi:hypothetical protein
MWRRLGVDGTFVAAAAGHITFIGAIAWLGSEFQLPDPLYKDVWMFGLGTIATSATLLAVWIVGGPRRLAARSIWAILLVQGVWLLVTQVILRRNSSYLELMHPFNDLVALFAGLLSLAVTTAVCLWWNWILMRHGEDLAIRRSSWRFGLADVLLAMAAVGLLVVARESLTGILRDIDRMFFGQGSWSFFRTAGAQCVVIGLFGVWAILGDRRRVVAVYFVAVATTIAAMMLNVHRMEAPTADDWHWSLRNYSCIGGGALLVVLGTLVPLRAWGWRIVKPTHLPAAA